MPEIIDQKTYDEIYGSVDQFDIAAPLTEDELKYMGQVVELQRRGVTRAESPVIQDLDDAGSEPEDVVDKIVSSDTYNARYLHYLRCQALASLVAFDEGWKALEELVLRPYVAQRQREDKGYRGSDVNQAFTLRLRRQEAEDFVKYLGTVIAELIKTPKPVLSVK